MTKLSVNVNKIATLRNARGGNVPDVGLFAKQCENFGACGITVHPRPDERHITYKDVYSLAKSVKGEFNIEGYPSKEFLKLVKEVQPDQVTLVPDPPGVLTSDAGWQVRSHLDFLTDIVASLQGYGIRVSIFVNPDINQVEGAKLVNADRVELFTGSYAKTFGTKEGVSILEQYQMAGTCAHTLGLAVNAGHDLDLSNLANFKMAMPFLAEVSIGHALVCDALYLGLEKTIKNYLNCL